MKKKIIIFATILFLVALGALATTIQVPSMTEDTSLGMDSLFYTVDDPGGSPVDRKVTMQEVADTVIAALTAVDIPDLSATYQPVDALLTSISTLADPNLDRILFWDDSTNNFAWLEAGTGLSISAQSISVDAELAAIAGLASAADTFPYFTGSGTAALTGLTAFARSVLDDSTEAAFKATVNLEPDTDFYAKTSEDTWRNSVSQTEMGYLHGVTSDIQTQIDALGPPLTDKASLEAKISDVTDFAEADGDTYTGSHDFGGASVELPNGTTLPSTCNAGEVYVDTDTTSGQQVYVCEAGTWKLQGDAGGNTTAYALLYNGSTGQPEALDLSANASKVIAVNSAGTALEALQTAYVPEPVAFHMFDNDTDVATGTSKKFFVVPGSPSMDGWRLIDLIVGCYTVGSGSTVTVNLYKKNASGTSLMLTSGVTLTDELFVADGSIKTDGTESIAEGDIIYPAVTGATGTVPKGLSITAVFQAVQ